MLYLVFFYFFRLHVSSSSHQSLHKFEVLFVYFLLLALTNRRKVSLRFLLLSRTEHRLATPLTEQLAVDNAVLVVDLVQSLLRSDVSIVDFLTVELHQVILPLTVIILA